LRDAGSLVAAPFKTSYAATPPSAALIARGHPLLHLYGYIGLLPRVQWSEFDGQAYPSGLIVDGVGMKRDGMGCPAFYDPMG